MLYLNDKMANEDWIRMAAMSSKPRRRNQPKIEKISLFQINPTKSILNSSSSSIFSSFSDDMPETSDRNQKVIIYNKSLNKSRNFFNSSSDTLSKMALKKRKLKFNKLFDDLERCSKSKSDKRIRSKSNRESRLLKQSSFSSLDSSSLENKVSFKNTLLKQKYKLNNYNSNSVKLSRKNSKANQIDSDLFTSDYMGYNSYGLIRFIPSKFVRPSLPPHLKKRYSCIEPPSKFKKLFHAYRNNRSRSSPKVSAFYSVDYDSPDDWTQSSIVDKSRASLLNKSRLIDENLNTIQLKAKKKPKNVTIEKTRKLKDFDSIGFNNNSNNININNIRANRLKAVPIADLMGFSEKSKYNLPPKNVIGDRPDKLKSYYLCNNNSKNLNESINYSGNSINSSSPSLLSHSVNKNAPKKNSKSLKYNSNCNSNFTKTVAPENFQYDIDKPSLKFNPKDIDSQPTTVFRPNSFIKENDSENTYQKITRQNRIIFYEDKTNLNEKIKYEANLPHLPEELKNAMKSIKVFENNCNLTAVANNSNGINNNSNLMSNCFSNNNSFNSNKSISSVKSPLARKKFNFNSVTKSINQDILENLSVILEEENTQSSKNSVCINSNSANTKSTNNLKSANSDTGSSNVEASCENENSTTKSSNEKSIIEDKLERPSKNIALEKDLDELKTKNENEMISSEQENTKKLSIDETQTKKDDLISNALIYLIAKETEEELKKKKINQTTNEKVQLDVLNGDKIIGALKNNNEPEVILIN